MKMRNFVIFASVAVVAALALSAAVAAQPGEPHLVNPNFEAGFTVREAAEVEVADGWDYAYLSGNDRQCRAPCYRPEFKPEREIVAQGQYSQRWFSTFSRQFEGRRRRQNGRPTPLRVSSAPDGVGMIGRLSPRAFFPLKTLPRGLH